MHGFHGHRLLTLILTCGALFAADIHVAPDGTGDGSSWNAAMGDLTEAMDQASDGDRVLLAAGTFVVDDDLRVPTGVSLIGRGTEEPERSVVTGSWSHNGGFPPSNSVIRVKDATDVLIQDLVIDGQEDQLSGGVYVLDSQRITIRGVHVLDTNWVGMWLVTSSEIEVDDCFLYNCGHESNAFSTGLLSLGGISDSRIHHTRIYGWDDNDGYGVKSMGGGNSLTRVTFDHLDIDVKPRAMWNGGSSNFSMELAHSSFAEEVRIHDCTFNMGLSLVGHDEYQGDAFSFELAHNYLDVIGGRWIELSTSRMRIHHNYFTGAHSGHATFNGYNPTIDQGDIRIHHNIFEYASKDLFGLQGSNGVSFVNNTVIWAPHSRPDATPYLARFQHDNSEQHWIVKNNLFLSPSDRTGELFNLVTTKTSQGVAPSAEVDRNFAPYFDLPGNTSPGDTHGLALDGVKPDPWWRLPADSPLVDSGVHVSDITDDAVGLPDVGAWEVGGDNRFLPDDFQWPVLPSQSIAVVPGIAYDLYDLPDDSKKMLKDLRDVGDLTPDASGDTATFDAGLVVLVDEMDEDRIMGDYAIAVFHGYIRAPETGLYRFWLTSEDASRLQIDGQDVLENDSWHHEYTVSDVVRLEAGLHSIRVYYGSWWGDWHPISLDWRVPGAERRAVVAGDLFRVDPSAGDGRAIGVRVDGAGPWQAHLGDENRQAEDGETVEFDVLAAEDPATVGFEDMAVGADG